ncbi:PilZ domain-containing protein [Roseibium aggregatum]|uniref:PilZ domain-containing protein n=1 Tax=Roseibium aggregatum TaxID=187304 RepID=A0A926P0L7_9HYPH|nr:PilZ domain-containing protein [Roseibium aggregatum]MBD1547605.1 PilZ domain-containing protein [Roseibium aggregatum]
MTALAQNIPEGATLAVLIVDLERLLCIEGSASGFTGSGCNILSHRVNELNEMVGLRVDGLEKMIKGRITYVTDGEAKVLFDFSESTKDQEKRKEQRRPVHIPARVSDLSGNASIHCIISNASKNGCRLEGQGIGHLPDDIFLRINGLDLPVRGSIAWRGPGCAGVRLLWQFTSGKEMKPVLKDMNPQHKMAEKQEVDFGRTRKRQKADGYETEVTAEAIERAAEELTAREQKRAERKARRNDAGAFGHRKNNPF